MYFKIKSTSSAPPAFSRSADPAPAPLLQHRNAPIQASLAPPAPRARCLWLPGLSDRDTESPHVGSRVQLGVESRPRPGATVIRWLRLLPRQAMIVATGCDGERAQDSKVGQGKTRMEPCGGCAGECDARDGQSGQVTRPTGWIRLRCALDRRRLAVAANSSC